MIKKMFSLLSAVMLMLSVTSMTTYSNDSESLYINDFDYRDCLSDAADFAVDFLDAGFSERSSVCLGGVFFLLCTGEQTEVSDEVIDGCLEL